MNDKKHIDRLFQEKLKDFEASPNDSVWENISAKLDPNKEERKVIPFWFKLSAIAGILLLMVVVGPFIFKNTNTTTNQNSVVNTETDKSSNTKTSNQEIKILLSEIDTLESRNSDSKVKINEIIGPQSIKTKNVSGNIKKSNTILPNQRTVTKSEQPIYNTTAKISNTNSIKKLPTQPNKATINTEAIKLRSNSKDEFKNSLTEAQTIKLNDSLLYSQSLEKDKETVTDKDNSNKKNVIASNNSLDNSNEEKKKKKKIKDRWKIAPSIAPVYFNTLGTGSSIHEQFNQNSKTGNVNMSYGIRGSYALNKKLSVRTGVNKVTLGYRTDDVFVLNNVTSTPTDDRFLLKNIDLKETAQDMSFVSVEEFNFAQIPTVISNQIIGSIDQKLGFIEIPLEIEYELSREKLGLRVLGGLSALFLNENEVYSSLDGATTLIGKATNINTTSFSANIGVGLDFKLSENFKLNLEPTFKYQLNTFNNTSGEFKPYFIGIYSGFSFKF